MISMPILNKCFEESGIKVVDNFGKSSTSLEEEVSKHLRIGEESFVDPSHSDDVPF